MHRTCNLSIFYIISKETGRVNKVYKLSKNGRYFIYIMHIRGSTASLQISHLESCET